MKQLVLITQTIFCLVSMTLTGLFALSLSGIEVYQLTGQEEIKSTLLLAVMFVLIGMCIDIGKYLFWMQRERSYYYGFISIVLMAFSWLASCAFFMTSESRLIEDAQSNSSEYAAYELRIDSLNQEISHQERLLNNRLASSYHSQWEAGQENADNISALRLELAQMLEGESAVGLDEAANQVSTTHFFTSIGEVLGISSEIVRLFGYGILSLLLEICTLGMISLSQLLAQTSTPLTHRYFQEKEDPRVDLLISDILSGTVEPVLRVILAKQYELGRENVRAVLAKLYQDKLITKGIRNSYRLVDKGKCSNE